MRPGRKAGLELGAGIGDGRLSRPVSIARGRAFVPLLYGWWSPRDLFTGSCFPTLQAYGGEPDHSLKQNLNSMRYRHEEMDFVHHSHPPLQTTHLRTAQILNLSTEEPPAPPDDTHPKS